MTLLIVDDNPNFRHLLKRYLRIADADCEECENGAQAVVAYNRHRHDWVLMDVEMDEMDGLAATRQILAADPQAQVVIVTQYDDEHCRTAAGEAGACAFVAKENLQSVREILRIDG